MKLSININKLQHITNGCIEFDIEDKNLICIAGKNGVGKTSLIKSMYLTKDLNIFKTNNHQMIIEKDTEISISIHKMVNGKDEIFEKLNYNYDPKIQYLNTKNIIKSQINIELPIPSGSRFTAYPKLANIDEELRGKYIRDEYEQDDGIIDFLNSIYPNCNKFTNLKKVNIGKKEYYFLILDNGKYVREDHLSSGEYFIINIYKMLISENQELLVIDEIDISLDASAQVNLVRKINELCKKYNKKIIFTTHSLVIMKTLYNELEIPIYYLSNNNGELNIIKTSYGFISEEMFGFKEYDKYIVTEDRTLEKYIEYILSTLPESSLKKKIRILYIGGAEEVKDFLQGSRFSILNSKKKDTIAILDGDKRNVELAERIFHVPFESVEKELYAKCKGKEDKYNLPPNFSPPSNCKAKKYYSYLTECLDEKSILKIIEEGWENEIETLKNNISEFLER